MVIRPFRFADEPQVIALWKSCELVRPWNDPQKDIQRKLQVQPELFLVGALDETIVATVMAGYEGHRGWLNYLAVSPPQQRRGFGRAILDYAIAHEQRAGATFFFLGASDEGRPLYEKVGFREVASAQLWVTGPPVPSGR